jgi:hypothetical protein
MIDIYYINYNCCCLGIIYYGVDLDNTTDGTSSLLKMVSVKNGIDAVGLNAEIIVPNGTLVSIEFYASQIKTYIFKVNILFKVAMVINLTIMDFFDFLICCRWRSLEFIKHKKNLGGWS